jgi:very-short-patch-repair endonuclease
MDVRSNNLKAALDLAAEQSVHTTAVCGPHDVIMVAGFRCASATRTVLDLAAAGASEHRLAQAIDSAVRLRKSAVVVLEKRLAALRGSGRGGMRRLDRLLLDSGARSVLERKFLTLVRENGLPRPKTQCRIPQGPRQVAGVDFLYADERLVIEVTGRLGHSTPTERAKDAQRRNELQDLGFAVYEYTWGDVTTRPRWVVTTLRERLARRRALTVV